MSSEFKRKRSVSQYKSYVRCGESYYWEKLRRRDLPERPAPWLALGVALHTVFCAWEQSDRTIDVVELFEVEYDSLIESFREVQPDLSMWIIPPNSKDVEKSIKAYRTRGVERDVPNYLERCLEAEWEIYRFDNGEPALELEFEIELDNVIVRGAVDRVQWWPERGYATIEDLKSGNLEKWNFLQLGTYGYALKEQFNIPIKFGRYWFTKTDQPSEWVDLSRYNKEYLSKLYNSLDEGVNNGIFLPNPGDHCSLCGVRPYCRELGTLPDPSGTVEDRVDRIVG